MISIFYGGGSNDNGEMYRTKNVPFFTPIIMFFGVLVIAPAVNLTSKGFR